MNPEIPAWERELQEVAPVEVAPAEQEAERVTPEPPPAKTSRSTWSTRPLTGGVEPDEEDLNIAWGPLE